jgi:hypothetical protein
VACGGNNDDSDKAEDEPAVEPANALFVEDKIAIQTLSDLEQIRHHPEEDFLLTADIVIDGAWSPIATFSGSLDGNGHKITFQKPAMTPATTEEYHLIGLIGINAGTISHLTVDGDLDYVAENDEDILMGGIAAANLGAIYKSKVTAHLSLTQSFSHIAVLGGIVGLSVGGSIYQVATTGRVTLDHWGDHNGFAGGIVGVLSSNSWASVADCYSTHEISNTANSPYLGSQGYRATGGIVGGAFDNVVIENCFSTADVQGSADANISQTGTIIGRAKADPYTQMLVTKTVSMNRHISGGYVNAPIGTPGDEIANIRLSLNRYDEALTGVAPDMSGMPVEMALTRTPAWWTYSFGYDFTHVWQWDDSQQQPIFIWE